MLPQTLNLVYKELIQFRRDRLLTPFILLGPALQLILLANATATDLTNLRVGVYDQDRSAHSRRLITALDNARQLDVRYMVGSLEEGTNLLDEGQLRMLVAIPPGFAADITAADRRPQLLLVVDGSNAIAARSLLQVTRGVLAHYQETLLLERGLRPGTPAGGIEVRSTANYNPELSFRHTALPAQLGLIVYMVTMLVAAFGISRERERGTMEQLLVTPLRRSELLIGKAAPVMAIALMDFAIMLAVITMVFHIPMRGSLGLLFALTTLYIWAEMGIGLVISSVSRSQQQSLLLVFLVGVLNVAFSGYLVPVENMPWLLSQMAQFFPVQHYMTILRMVMLKGAGLADLYYHVAALIMLGIAISSTAYAVAMRRLD